MPRARRPALHSAETSFRGKGAAACMCRPRPFQVGGFLCVLLPLPCGITLLPSLWGKRRRGGSKPWFLPQHCLPLSSIPVRQRRNAAKPASLWSRLTRDVSHVCWGCSTVCRRTSTCGSSRMGRLPSWVYGSRDLSRGEPVRLSVGHMGPLCGVCRWRFPYAPLPCGCSIMRNAWLDRAPVAANQPAMVWQWPTRVRL
jgi:hypothetical protein